MQKLQVAPDECPLAPPPQVTVYTRVLHRACQIVGGVERLAERLGVSRTMLHRWLEGEGEPPSAIFLKAVDIVLPTWGPEDDAIARAIKASRPRDN